MSSRAWTEVATGAEAASFRRWQWRVGVGITARNLMLLAGVIFSVLLFAALFREVVNPQLDCFDQCADDRPDDLIDLID
jgi:hypothetical protein